jgi:GNAT superfamily N-acetyltransferase
MLQIRKAIERDVPRLLEIFSELEMLHRAECPAVFKEGRSEDFEEKGRSIVDPARMTLVATMSGEVVGYAYGQIREMGERPFLHSRKILWVDELAVTKSKQRQGIAKELLKSAEDWARVHDCPIVELNVWKFNEPAFWLYEEAGYEVQSLRLGKKVIGS